MSDHRPGDVVNGWVLGRDLQWHPASTSPSAAGDPFDFGTPAGGWGAGTSADARSFDTRASSSWPTHAGTSSAGASDSRAFAPVISDPRFDGGGEAPQSGLTRKRAGLLAGVAAVVGLVIGVLLGGGPADADTPSTAAAPAPTVTVTMTAPMHTAAPLPAVTVTRTVAPVATKTKTSSSPPVQGLAGGLGSGSSADDDSDDAPAAAYFKNCTAARAAGAAPLYRGDPGYRSALDRDDDGVACE